MGLLNFLKCLFIMIYERIYAAFIDRVSKHYNIKKNKYKKRLFVDIHDRVNRLKMNADTDSDGSTSDQDPMNFKILEIGAGSGANFQFYPDGIEVLCLEPVECFEKYIDEKKSAFPHLNLHFVKGKSEDLSFIENESIDAVVCTLVLCSVDDLAQSLKEIKRVLKPNCCLYYMEHISAPKEQWLYTLQMLISPVWGALAGCHFRETWKYIEGAGFSDIDHIKTSSSKPFNPIGPHLTGKATK